MRGQLQWVETVVCQVEHAYHALHILYVLHVLKILHVYLLRGLAGKVDHVLGGLEGSQHREVQRRVDVADDSLSLEMESI